MIPNNLINGRLGQTMNEMECLPVELTRSVLILVTVAPALTNFVDVHTAVL
jgi:hypothetical protein